MGLGFRVAGKEKLRGMLGYLQDLQVWIA